MRPYQYWLIVITPTRVGSSGESILRPPPRLVGVHCSSSPPVLVSPSASFPTSPSSRRSFTSPRCPYNPKTSAIGPLPRLQPSSSSSPSAAVLVYAFGRCPRLRLPLPSSSSPSAAVRVYASLSSRFSFLLPATLRLSLLPPLSPPSIVAPATLRLPLLPPLSPHLRLRLPSASTPRSPPASLSSRLQLSASLSSRFSFLPPATLRLSLLLPSLHQQLSASLSSRLSLLPPSAFSPAASCLSLHQLPSALPILRASSSISSLLRLSPSAVSIGSGRLPFSPL